MRIHSIQAPSCIGVPRGPWFGRQPGHHSDHLEHIEEELASWKGDYSYAAEFGFRFFDCLPSRSIQVAHWDKPERLYCFIICNDDAT